MPPHHRESVVMMDQSTLTIHLHSNARQGPMKTNVSRRIRRKRVENSFRRACWRCSMRAHTHPLEEPTVVDRRAAGFSYTHDENSLVGARDKLRIAEALQRANAENDLLASKPEECV